MGSKLSLNSQEIEKYIKENLKNRLKEERKKCESKDHKGKSISQKELADILGVTVKTYRSWEIGETLPKTIDLYELSIVFNCSVDYLIGLNTDENRFRAYIEKTYALPPESFDQLNRLYLIMNGGSIIPKKSNSPESKEARHMSLILQYLINTSKGNILLDQLSQYIFNSSEGAFEFDYNALLFGQHVYSQKTTDLCLLNDIENSISDMRDYLIKNTESN